MFTRFVEEWWLTGKRTLTVRYESQDLILTGQGMVQVSSEDTPVLNFSFNLGTNAYKPQCLVLMRDREYIYTYRLNSTQIATCDLRQRQNGVYVAYTRGVKCELVTRVLFLNPN